MRAAATLSVLLAVALAAPGCGGGAGGGSVESLAHPNAWTTYGRVSDAPRLFAGAAFFRAHGKAVRLVRVTLHGATPGLRVTGAQVAGPRRALSSLPGGARRVYADSRQTDLHRLDGYRLRPGVRGAHGDGIEVIVGLAAPSRPGRYGTRGLELHYLAGGREHTVSSPSAFFICLGSRYGEQPGRRRCPPPRL